MGDAENPDPAPPGPQPNPPVPPPVVVSEDEPEFGEAEAKAAAKETKETKEVIRDTRTIEWLQFVVNTVLALVGVIAIVVYHGQLRVMKGQLGEIIKQFPEIQAQRIAMQGQLTAVQEQTELSERPWIDVSNLTLTGPLVINDDGTMNTMVHLTAQNVGKTPAVGVWVTYSFANRFRYSSILKMCTQERKVVPQFGISGEILFPNRILDENMSEMIEGTVVRPTNAQNVFLLPTAIIGCVQYMSAVSGKSYYTGFSYQLDVIKTLSSTGKSEHIYSVTFDPKTGIARTSPDSPLSGGKELKVTRDWILFEPGNFNSGAIVK